MKVNPISVSVRSYQQQNNVKQNQNSHKTGSIVFKTHNLQKTRMIERSLAQKGIKAKLRDNDFVAECVEKTTDVFKGLFGKSALPEKVRYKPFQMGDRVYGFYNYLRDEVGINSDYDDGCFYNANKLKDEMHQYRKIILPEQFSSLHPGHVFVHEFAHSAHWHHLKDRNGSYSAERVWDGLKGVTVPTAIGRLITRFKLSNYAVNKDSMCEFMAERMSKDICGGLTDNMWVPYKDIDVGYGNIFGRKWDYRYSTPQSYIDYFTQQVWNGDIEEAEKAGEDAAAYLAELDAVRVAPKVQAVANSIAAAAPGLLNSIGEAAGEFLSSVGEGLTNVLDRRNKIKLNG